MHPIGLTCLGRASRITLATAAAIGLSALAVHAQSAPPAGYPTKPVKLIVGFAAGGPADIVGRVVGAKLGDALGQQFVVENRGGAGGNIATDAVGRAEPDAYSLLVTPLVNAVNETLYKDRKIRWSPARSSSTLSIAPRWRNGARSSRRRA